jgi:predicted SnoaL-like aldol condensation-catalyzing enzyme
VSDLTLAYDFADILNAGEVERFDDLVHPDYINHNRYAGAGRDGVKAVFGAFLQALPDLAVTVHDALVSGDRVVGRYSYTGTFTGPLLGNAPTGERVTMTSIDIWRVEDGRFVEHWDEINSLELFVQLGAVAAAGPVAS